MLTKQDILNKIKQSSDYGKLCSYLSEDKKVFLRGFLGSYLSFLISEIFKSDKTNIISVFPDKEQAAYFLNELEDILNKESVLFFPSSYKRAYFVEDTENANVGLRAEIIKNIIENSKNKIIVTYPEAIFEKVINKSGFEKNTLKIKTGDSFSMDFIVELLEHYDFIKRDYVSQAGDYALRGGIIDIFSFGEEKPCRIEFFSDKIESIRSFDVATQLSIEKKDNFTIVPNIESKQGSESETRTSLLEYFDDNSIVLLKDSKSVFEKLDNLFEKAKEQYQNVQNSPIKRAKPETLFFNAEEFKKELEKFKVIENSQEPFYKTEKEVDFFIKAQKSFHRNFDLLCEDLKQNTENGILNVICCSTSQQSDRLKSIFSDIDKNLEYSILVSPISEGFIDEKGRISLYTDHQIFERYQRFKLKSDKAKVDSISISDLNLMEIGDFVTHIDHGVGKFGGLQKIQTAEGKTQEAIKLTYAGGDILYVGIHSLHKISKYLGKDSSSVTLNKLGSATWQNLKEKAKKRVKQIAFDLIKLYAERKSVKGFKYSPDTYLQNELEASFIYEDTPDQYKATEAVKMDMESDKPMDRLVCGDVGFGKTEVAIRAAFKAVCDSKQVVVLVPTTILAFQHFRSFSARLKRMPCRVDYLNRFRTAKEKAQIIKDLKEGKIDIIIGTHQVVSDKIKFKDLGLLIIDEEHKFGVNVKDKIKTFKTNIDTLTLTATPIPRTLQFSLMAARDLSVIATPPPNRYPIETNIITFSEEIIRDAISYEISRGGQVFFINNRIENIREIAGMIQRLVPDAKIAIGHGQLKGDELEKLMLGFMEGAYDVLISTTIVESGLDVPNANTIFINDAHKFGLSDLHQMRGRVGRSNKKAFCYYIAPPFSELTQEAQARLDALERFSEIGQGINIAMKDLEIRGAGDLLGAEQSGFIADIGFDTYQKILQETVIELKNNEFKDVFYQNPNDTIDFIKIETQIESDIELLIPDSYISSTVERLKIYNKLADAKTDEQLGQIKYELEDRMGKIPKQVEDLFLSIKIKWIASSLGFERLIIKKGKAIAILPNGSRDDYYKSNIFTKILAYVSSNTKNCLFGEKKDKNGNVLLSFTILEINSLEKLYSILNGIL